MHWYVLLLAGIISAASAADEAPASATASAVTATGDAADQAWFRQRIAPLLQENCWRCHGPTKQRADLRLDSRAAVLRGGRTAVVVPGHPEQSRLIDAVGYDDPDLQMPPAGILSAGERADLAAWIARGLPWAPAVVPPAVAPTSATVR